MFNWIIFTQRFIIASELFKSVNATKEMKLETEHDKYITFIDYILIGFLYLVASVLFFLCT